jgi:hypothetical protein
MVAMLDATETIKMLRECAQRPPLDAEDRLLSRAADELETLNSTVADAAFIRSNYLTAWMLWVEQNASTDVVEWLRLYGSAYLSPNPDAVSAEEARQVQSIFDAVLAKCEEAASEIERLRELVSASYRLREERDEARRMVCGLDADIMEDQVEYARHRGWDCFPREDGK